ncbi:hypothetical protein PHMEG_00036188 [Phytophthora megakarya]|uniref:Uncharacterized protein n=1 Tax=Phytophthora megakarya TaxID=4795 RepID=A0A225UMJ1_9STRA|nr:hypothetical protein PHMEG_00036188 [Phytophthora megakarya]
MLYKKWYEMRKNKAFSALALSLSVDLRTMFKIDDIREHMDAAAMLYARITQHFEAGDGINPDYLLQDLVTRKLQPNDSVTTYVEDIARKVTQLHQANGEVAEWQHASPLLSNCVEKFHDLAREHGDWINNHDRKTLCLAEALQRLHPAEHQRAQLRVQTRQPALRVAQVSADQGEGQGPRANHKRDQKQRKRNKFVTDKKQRTSCANCQGEEHWYSECANTGLALRPELLAKLQAKKQKRQQSQLKQPVSLVNSVRRVEVGDAGFEQQGLTSLSLCETAHTDESADLWSDVNPHLIYR